MNPDRAALMAGAPPPAMANKPKPTNSFTYQNSKSTSSWTYQPPKKDLKLLSRSQKKQDGQKKQKRPWTKEKPTSKRSQRAGPRSLAKQGLRVRTPKTPEQKAKQLERKLFRQKQQAGAAARKIIKTARREGYRVVKRTARPMKEYQARYRLALISIEGEAVKKVHIEVDEWERRNAMAFCNSLGFTIENTEGTKDIKPRVLGMKGKELDIDNLEKELHAAEEKLRAEKADREKYGDHRGNRVDMSKIIDESKTTQLIGSGAPDQSGMDGDFISFDMDDNDEPVPEDDINYNHRMRRKLNRAILAAHIKKENLVRARALAHCEKNGIEPPKGFTASHQPAKLDNHRMLVDGSIETAKQERIRKRVETAKYNELARAFRKTAKAAQKAAEEKAQREILEQHKVDRLAKGLPIDDLEKNPPWAEHFSEKSRRVQREKRKAEARADAREAKKSSNSSGSSSDGDSSDSDSSSVASKSEGSKKRSRSESEEVSRDNKKIKVSENAAKPVSTESNGSSDQSAEVSKSSESKVEKKKSKKSVRIADPPEVVMEDAPDIPEEKDEEKEKSEKTAKKEKKKEKKDKKERKVKKEKSAENTEKEPETRAGNDWNADALDGDAARKDKFLRLLGGKKDTATSKSAVSKSKKAGADISKVQSDLEKQFQQGIELKHGGGGQGKRRGIGA